MKYKALSLVLVVFLLGGCDHAIDCLDNDGPVFNQRALSSPVLNQVYEDRISVSIKNEPLDDQYDYEFSYTGRLPAGITARSSGRIYQFEGTPTELGRFEIDVLVKVSGSNSLSFFTEDESGLCYNSRRQTFVLDIQTM